ncbi:hypothetical protein [Pseudogracilibacillus auburnensis]|uniref:hypothetical protein n=1 Tax=Pseudogracilibacillus auburnensis TaxID=1494959 RepID=UPI0027DA95CA|nr:hypothetical protein [Pseudogracilibacillus auburnensis]
MYFFGYCSAILFGRNGANMPVEDYPMEDVYQDLRDELQTPIVYGIDCGHLPPRNFINSAYAEVQVNQGKGTVLQTFRP